MKAFWNEYHKIRDSRAEWREGQMMFNALLLSHPDIANEIRGTDIDPFYKSDVEYFWTWLGVKLGGDGS